MHDAQAFALKSPETERPSRVLLVDDDADALRLLGIILRRAGFEFAVAASGEEGLALLDGGERFDVLVTDCSMPDVTGVKLVKLARARRPGLPALVTSGYQRDHGMRGLPADVEMLAKPFSRDDLLRRIFALANSARASLAG